MIKHLPQRLFSDKPLLTSAILCFVVITYSAAYLSFELRSQRRYWCGFYPVYPREYRGPERLGDMAINYEILPSGSIEVTLDLAGLKSETVPSAIAVAGLWPLLESYEVYLEFRDDECWRIGHNESFILHRAENSVSDTIAPLWLDDSFTEEYDALFSGELVLHVALGKSFFLRFYQEALLRQKKKYNVQPETGIDSRTHLICRLTFNSLYPETFFFFRGEYGADFYTSFRPCYVRLSRDPVSDVEDQIARFLQEWVTLNDGTKPTLPPMDRFGVRYVNDKQVTLFPLDLPYQQSSSRVSIRVPGKITSYAGAPNIRYLFDQIIQHDTLDVFHSKTIFQRSPFEFATAGISIALSLVPFIVSRLSKRFGKVQNGRRRRKKKADGN